MNYYNLKDSSYYSGTRLDLISLLTNNKTQSVLEVGAGGGDTLCFIKENELAGKVTGVELFKFENSNQSNPLIDSFLHANIEDQNLDFPKESFDVIILADVLEHLIDPWKTIAYLKTFLKKEGKFLISLPNIRDYKSMLKIFFKGDFQYSEDGVLDKTHLRFFCRKNMIEMIEGAGLQIELSSPAFKYRSDRNSRKMLNSLSLGLFQEYFAIQYLFVASKR